MNSQLKKASIERYSRQIVLKDIGTIGQKKIISSKVLIVGMGGLGSPVAEFLARAGVGSIGIVDDDKVSLSNLHRQSLYNTSDIGKFKVQVVKVKIKKINPSIKIKIYKIRLDKNNFKKIIKDYDYIVDGSDNFSTKFLLNDFCYKFKKIPCLRCFFQDSDISDDLLNCESEGILGTVAGIIGTIQANEVLKKILGIGKSLDGYIFILDLLQLNFRKVKLKKRKNCFCK